MTCGLTIAWTFVAAWRSVFQCFGSQARVESPQRHGVVLYRVMFAWVCVPNDSVDSFKRRGTNVWAHMHEHATLKGMVHGIT